MAVCSLEECLRPVIFALYETSKEIYILAAQVSCRLRDGGFGGVYLTTSTLRDVALAVSQSMAHYRLLTF